MQPATVLLRQGGSGERTGRIAGSGPFFPFQVPSVVSAQRYSIVGADSVRPLRPQKFRNMDFSSEQP